jgi:hypothetical protein
MRTYRKWRRRVPALALAGCLTALAVPAVAGAMPIRDSGYVAANDGSQPYTLPASFKTDVQSGAPSEQAFTLPASFKTDVQSGAPSEQAFTLPASFRAEVTSPPQSAPASAPVIVRDVRTVHNYDGRTLAIVLASVALGIALCGTGWAVVRLTQMQRRAIGSSS